MQKVSRNKDKGNFLVRYIKSLIHALEGLKYAIVYEHNMIIIVAAIIVVTIAGFYFKSLARFIKMVQYNVSIFSMIGGDVCVSRFV